MTIINTKIKTMKKLLAIAFALVAFSASSFAQLSATSTAAAVIIAPLTITNTVGLHFGTVMRGTTAGTVELTTAGVRTPTGGVTLSPAVPTLTVASFTITGEPNRAYTITLPAADVTITDGTNNMIVNTFVSNPAAGTYTPAVGSTTLLVGATLNVLANQPSGTYNGSFDVSVNYN